MATKAVLIAGILVILTTLATKYEAEARYLPTRSNGDRIDKLRELLKDLLESELEKDEAEPPRWRPENKYFKREVKMSEAPAKSELKSLITKKVN